MKEKSRQNSQIKNIFIFYCEFSQRRGPDFYKLIRKIDRQKNKSSYPYLDYPEIYLLQDGYSNFCKKFPWFCMKGENQKQRFLWDSSCIYTKKKSLKQRKKYLQCNKKL